MLSHNHYASRLGTSLNPNASVKPLHVTFQPHCLRGFFTLSSTHFFAAFLYNALSQHRSTALSQTPWHPTSLRHHFCALLCNILQHSFTRLRVHWVQVQHCLLPTPDLPAPKSPACLPTSLDCNKRNCAHLKRHAETLLKFHLTYLHGSIWHLYRIYTIFIRFLFHIYIYIPQCLEHDWENIPISSCPNGHGKACRHNGAE